MAVFEYKVIPAPLSGKRAKGVKGADGRFANALSETINELAQAGWEYQRAESLPSVERKGVMRKRHETYQNVLVFRRETDAVAVTDDAEAEGFNPFKRFNTKKEPVVTAAKPETAKAPAAEAPKPKDDEIIDEIKAKIDADDVEEMPKTAPKPED